MKWCQARGENEGGFENDIVLANCDFLIIHVDADIASEADLRHLSLSAPCPPPKVTCDNIRSYIISLLGGNPPPKVVFCIPAQCTEAWIVAALHPEEALKRHSIECKSDPERLLIQKPDKLVRIKDGTPRKQAANYRVALGKIVDKWSDATAACSEASRFETECRATLAAIERTMS